jgi:hypothetical protein
MKRNILTLAIAAQLAAFGAVAQTSDTGTADPGMASGSFGSDWSATLGAAIFEEDGTTVRSESELSTQWSTLSAEDQDMLRRDCTAYMAESGDGAEAGTDETGSTETTTDGTGAITGDATASADVATGGADATADAGADTGMAGGSTSLEVSMEQMEDICAGVEGL